LADLDVFAEEKSKQEILTLDDYALFIENLRGWQHDWKKRKTYQISASTRPMKVASSRFVRQALVLPARRKDST